MFESFCIVYRDGPANGSLQKLSSLYFSLEAAINAAFLISQKNYEVLEIRGSEGSVMSKTVIERALFVSAA